MFQENDPIGPALVSMQHRSIGRSMYLGIPAIKCPADAWTYRELIYDRHTSAVVELGVRCGGHLLSIAHFLDAMKSDAAVIGVDVDLSLVHPSVVDHPRVRLFELGAVEAFPIVSAMCVEGAMVIEDSSHTYDNTLAVLRAYKSIIPVGGYFIVEDTICHHPLNVGPLPGPYEAVETFLQEEGDFERDAVVEPEITWNPGGYLRRKR